MNYIQLIILSIFALPTFLLLLCHLVGLIGHIKKYKKLRVVLSVSFLSLILLGILNFNMLIMHYVKIEDSINDYLISNRPQKESQKDYENFMRNLNSDLPF